MIINTAGLHAVSRTGELPSFVSEFIVMVLIFFFPFHSSLFLLLNFSCMWKGEKKHTVSFISSEASTCLNKDLLPKRQAAPRGYNLRTLHHLHSYHSDPCHLPDYFHIKHRGLLAKVKSRTMVFIWVAWQCLSTGCASKRVGENRRIPLILSNWVAAFAAVHRMWETRDKKTSIYPLLLSLLLLLLFSLLLLSPPCFSRACYCLKSMLSVSPSPDYAVFCFHLKFSGKL